MLCGGVGNAPGCGAGGPSSLVFLVGVGCNGTDCTGTYLCDALVGAGIAAAPGCAAGYEPVEDGTVVVVARFTAGPRCVFGVGGGAAVFGVTPSALAALMGLSV
jgi:hypothetical protein